MAIKVYSPINFEDTSSGLSIDGDFAVDTNTLFVDVSTDRVGIGTTSPVSALDVNGVITLSGDTEHTIQRLTSSNITSETTHVTQIQGRQIDLFAYDDVWLRAGSTDNIGFVAGGSTRMYINRYGDVGIGTTSPTEELHIEGEVKIQPKHTSATPPSLYLGDLNNQFQSGMSSTGHLTFRSTSNTYFQTGGANYRMMIDNVGKVGIGTLSPSYKLDVAGTSRFTDSVRIDTTGTALEITGTTTVDSSDVSIYLGNSPSAYGFYITYVGSGGGNTNAFRIRSTNAGSPKTLLTSNQDGIVNFPNGLQLNGAGVATQSWVGSQSYATQSYVNTQVSNLVDSAPGTLDTLNELAAALGDDANFSTTVTNSIATKVPLSGDATITGMKTFATVVSSEDDWENSPISILERDNIGNSSTSNTYAPNLNFHWASRVSNSLWMNYLGDLHWGSYSGTGVPAVDGTFKAGTLYAGSGQITSTKVSNWDTAYGWGDHASAGYLTAHPSITEAADVNNSGGNVIQDLTFDENGHVTATGTVDLDSRYYTETEIDAKISAYTAQQSGSDFANGTFVRTSIVANVQNGDSFLLEITGKSYSSSNYPFKVILQGYIYNNTFISTSALSYGGNFPSTIKILEDNGDLCFWWARYSYWNSFKVTVNRVSSGDSSPENLVESIYNAADATYTKQVTVNVRKSLTQNISTGYWALDSNPFVVNGTTRFSTGGNARQTITLGATNEVALAMGISYSNMSYVRQQGNGIFQWQTYYNGNNGQLQLQPYGGNVGIGTTSPGQKLDVAGDIRSSQRLWLSSIDAVSISGSDLRIGYSNNNLLLRAGSAERMRINSSGNVGIGTTSPDQKLHVVGNAKVTGVFYTDYVQTLGGTSIDFRHQDASTIMRVDTANARVGIGTTSPSSKLHVVGDFFLKGSDTSSSTKNFQVQTGNGTSIMDFRNDAYAFFGCGQGGGSASGFIFRYNSTFGVQFTGYNYGNGTSPSYKPILMDTDLAGRSQGVYINYGITGYTAPAPTSNTEFAVRGRGTGSNYTAKFEDSSTNPLLYIKDNGNVTVGSSTDNGYKLDVEGNTNTNGDYYVNGSQGWSGTITIDQSPNPPIDITVEGGIITNVT